MQKVARESAATGLGTPASCGRNRGEQVPCDERQSVCEARPQDAGVPSELTPSARARPSAMKL